MKSRIKINWFLILLICLICNHGYCQEQILRDLAASHKDARPYAIYPSTLRMFNLTNKKTFNDFVKPVKKILAFQLDSAMNSEQNFSDILETYKRNGFEEYFFQQSENGYLVIIGKDDSEFFGLFHGWFSKSTAFYMYGFPDLKKLPEVIEMYNNGDFIDISKIIPK